MSCIVVSFVEHSWFVTSLWKRDLQSGRNKLLTFGFFIFVMRLGRAYLTSTDAYTNF